MWRALPSRRTDWRAALERERHLEHSPARADERERVLVGLLAYAAAQEWSLSFTVGAVWLSIYTVLIYSYLTEIKFHQ